MRFRINLDTPPLVLKKIYKNSKGCLPPVSDSLSSQDLITLINTHRRQRYEDALYHYIAFHKNVTDEIHSLMLENCNYDSGVADAVATSGKASMEILEKLLEHESNHTVEHAKLAIIFSGKASMKALMAMLSDTSEHVVEAAQIAIKRLHENKNSIHDSQ